MKRIAHRMLVGTLCLGAGSGTVCAQGKLAERYPMTAEAIARALQSDGLNIHAEDVRMPMLLSTAVSNPSLQMIGADRLPDGHLRLRLRCRNAGECLTFSVTLAHSDAAPVLLASTIAQQSSGNPTNSNDALTEQRKLPMPNETLVEPTFVRAGARLTMLLEDGHMLIHLPVVSLDSAAGDKEIHVATPDRKHTYRATVVNATTVRGIME